MDKELKPKWVAALRSGDYQQTQFLLKAKLTEELPQEGAVTVGYGYCCLGVLCEAAGAICTMNGPQALFEMPDGLDLNPGGDQELGRKALKLFGLNQDQHAFLIMMNDGTEKNGNSADRKSFAEIADWIEGNL